MSSTTGANKDSNPHDFLVTPAWTSRAILTTLTRTPPLRLVGSLMRPKPTVILDPCSGDGAILEVAHEVFPEAEKRGLEIDPIRCALANVKPGNMMTKLGDALALPTWADEKGKRPDLICTNPPFSLAMPFLERALAEVAEGGDVAFLLRLAWLSSLDRVAFHKKHPSDVYVLDRRPSFAASLKCKARKKTGCTYRTMLALSAVRPKACPLCGAGIDVTTNDSADYAWFCFGPGRGNRWWILEG